MLASGRPVMVAGLLVVVQLATTVGCADHCEDVDCGSGVLVRWAPGDLPEAASYRLCVNDRCEPVEPYADGIGDDLMVAPSSGIGEDEVVVDLELLDSEGARVALLSGAGNKTGQCCPGIAFRVTDDGALADEPI